MPPDLVLMACINNVVEVKCIRKYFTVDAWKSVHRVVTAEAKNKVYSCGVCDHKLGKQSVG